MPESNPDFAGTEPETLVWGAAAIGRMIGLDRRQTFYQLEAGRIAGARKFGRKWAAPSRSLRLLINGEAWPQ